jgi:hypothetical protein
MFERAQAAGTSPAARLGHGFSEACQEESEPKPGGDLTREGREEKVGDEETAKQEHRGQDGSYLDHEQGRVGDKYARVEPAQGRTRGLACE